MLYFLEFWQLCQLLSNGIPVQQLFPQKFFQSDKYRQIEKLEFGKNYCVWVLNNKSVIMLIKDSETTFIFSIIH